MTTPLGSLRPAAFGALFGAAALVGGAGLAPSAAMAQEELDLYAENAWAIDQINAEAAWQTTKGAGVVVAVADTGIAEEHPFLEDKDILDGKSFMGSDEPNGRVDKDGHGTGVSSAVLYAAPEATILPVRIESTSADVGFGIGANEVDFEGIRWAADNGADVLVLPWGEIAPDGVEPSQEFLEVVQYAIDKDVVVIAAGGNDPATSNVGNPASFDGVVTVSGTDKNGSAWSGNTASPDIELAAPADTMTYPKPQLADFGDEELYFEAAGTSAAAGIVGGVAALVRAAHPDLDASNTIQRLITTADDGGAGKTETLGFGLVDAGAAVNEDVDAVEENPLGYPLGAAGASGASPDEDPSAVSPSDETSDRGNATEAESGTDMLPIVVVAAAIVLLVAGIAVWLALRRRSKSQVEPWH